MLSSLLMLRCAVKVQFVNLASVPVTAYWIGYEGVQKRVNQILPHSTLDEGTTTGHAFRFTNPKDDTIIAEVLRATSLVLILCFS